MSALRLHLDRFARRAGIAGALGAVAIAIIPGYYWTVVRPLRAHADSLAFEYEVMLTRANTGGTHGDASSTQEARLRAFHGFFPTTGEIPGWIAKIYVAADKEGIVLPRGEYRRPASKQEQSPMPLRISMPVKGRYADIRRFVTSALADVPMLALEEIVFQRQAANDAQIEAEIRFTLFIGGR